MAKEVRPTLRSIIVCERIVPDPENLNRVSLNNVINSIRPTGEPPYPLAHGQLSVFAQVTECRGIGRVRVDIRRDETDELVFRTRTREVTFPNHPLVVYGFRFRILGCVFPAAGVYWVQLWYDDGLLGQLPISLTSDTPHEGE